MKHPNPTSIAHRLLNAGIGSISAEAAKKISQSIAGSRPTFVTILQTVLNLAAAHEIRIVDVAGQTILESRTERNTQLYRGAVGLFAPADLMGPVNQQEESK